jgi:hypothetical protein
VRHEGSAEGGKQDAGGAVVNPLAADPDTAAVQIEPDQLITVCPR